jgi:hypothetical protein
MADTVDTLVLLNGKRRYRVRLLNASDGTGESSVVKVTKSALTNLNGVAPTKLSIEKIEYNIQGFSSVRLYWNHTTPDEIAFLPAGAGWIVYEPMISDPGSAGGTGDIILFTASAVNGATYDIILHVVQGN